jgi:hypothetical protein
MITLLLATVAKGPSEMAVVIELLGFVGKPGGWLIAMYFAWKYILKDVVQSHVAMSENNRASSSSAERAAASHAAGSEAAKATVQMAREIVDIAKSTIEQRRE